jgi:hypothetical protein
MTKNGTKDARIQYRDEAAKRGYYIDLQAHAKGISILLMTGLTIFLSWREQYLYSLCSACLALASATCDRLKRIRLGRQGFQGEWEVARRSDRARP